MSPVAVCYKTNLFLAVILIILIELKVENVIKSRQNLQSREILTLKCKYQMRTLIFEQNYKVKPVFISFKEETPLDVIVPCSVIHGPADVLCEI